MTGRLVRRFDKIRADTPLRLRVAYLITNIRCKDDWNSSFDNLPQFIEVVMSKNVTFTFVQQQSDDDNNHCILSGLFKGIHYHRVADPTQFKTSVPGDCDLPVKHESSTYTIGYRLTTMMRPTDTENTNLLWIILGSAAGVSTAIIIVGCLFLYNRKRKHRLKGSSTDSHTGRTAQIPEILHDVTVDCSELSVSWNVVIGSGAFSQVFEGRLTRRDVEHVVAVKVLRDNPHEDINDIWLESELMKSLGSHAHIIGLLGCTVTENGPALVLEYCDAGDLLRFLRSEVQQEYCPSVRAVNTDIPNLLLAVSFQISDGMVFLSSKKCIHRDLAARNVLLTRDLTAKISDFGLCRYAQQEMYTAQNVFKLPYKWMAPESLRDVVFSTYSDVWSFGVLLYEIFSSGTTPYADIETAAELLAFLDSGQRLQLPFLASPEIYRLMNWCWQLQPKERPSFCDVRAALAQLRGDVPE